MLLLIEKSVRDSIEALLFIAGRGDGLISRQPSNRESRQR